MFRCLALALVLSTLGCHIWPFGPPSRDAGAPSDESDDAAAPLPDGPESGELDADAAPPVADGPASDGAAKAEPPGLSSGGSALPVEGAVPGDQLAAAVATVVAQPGWGTDVDAGISTDDAAALPAAAPGDGPLALARAVPAGKWRTGCGEPPSCFLRMALLTASGRLYTARLGATYPSDSCARDVIDDGKNVLIGDSHGRFGNLRCSTATPQITVGFLIPNQVFGTNTERRWSADDGFRSQWTLVGGAQADNGIYLPAPSTISTLDLLWFARFSKGEAYGSLVVPLRNSATGAAALGELIFDVRIR